MAAHRVGGRMGDIFTAHEGRKNGTIRKEPRQLPFRTTCCSSRQPLSSPFPLGGRRSGERGDTKNARGEKALL